jgi:hypothetical protein
MAYETSNPPALIAQGIGGAGMKIYIYNDDDATADVDGNGYITNGDDLGMDVGDIVIHEDLSAETTNQYRVDSVTAGGAVDLANGTVTGSATDSD